MKIFMKFFLKLTKNVLLKVSLIILKQKSFTQKVSLIILKQKKSRIYFQRNILNDIHRRLTENEAIIVVRELSLKNIYAHKRQRLIIMYIIISLFCGIIRISST
jgi:hypothetical protein